MSVRILAIETSAVGGEVALTEGERLVVGDQIAGPRRHAELLVPAIQLCLNEAGWRLTELDLVAVGIGPGSYTGLRVGVTCAKTLAYAAGLDCIGVGTLETIAQNAPPEATAISVVSDAQRGQVYAASFRRVLHGERAVVEPADAGARVVDADPWISHLGANVWVLGPGLRRYRHLVPDQCRVAPPPCWVARAESVARLGRRAYRDGRRDDPYQLQPLYLRKSAAEETWDQRQQTT